MQYSIINKTVLVLFILSTLSLNACHQPKNKIAKFHASHWPRKTNAPYSDTVQVDNLLFLSGQVGIDNTTRKLVTGGIRAETQQTLENIKAILNHHGLTMQNVVKCTVILSDIDNFTAFNEIYKTYLPQKPARTTFAASGLAINAKIEIECIAHT